MSIDECDQTNIINVVYTEPEENVGKDECKIYTKDKHSSSEDMSYFESKLHWDYDNTSKCPVTVPILVVTTLQENGAILVANYVVLEAKDYEFHGDVQDKTNELIGAFCTKIAIDFSSTIVPEQEFINFSFPATADAEF